ncbi:MAG: hypothetical protein HQ581_24395 [Planctomycetes bacterium]|nr:hypothetical protein [Planctomycetota bacterium]
MPNVYRVSVWLILLGAMTAGCSDEPEDRPEAADTTPELVLYISPDGSVTDNPNEDEPFSKAQLKDRLQRWLEVAPEPEGTHDEFENFFEPSGPELALVVRDAESTEHAVLDKLLHFCVDCGVERFSLRRDHPALSSGEYAYRFGLVRSLPSGGIPDPDMYPPLPIQLRSGSDGRLSAILIGTAQCADFGDLRGRLLDLQLRYADVIGKELGRGSFHVETEIEFDCDGNLQLIHLFRALDTLTAYRDGQGKWVRLIEKYRPVAWGDGFLELDLDDVVSAEAFFPTSDDSYEVGPTIRFGPPAWAIDDPSPFE